jgi:hypothetical protein
MTGRPSRRLLLAWGAPRMLDTPAPIGANIGCGLINELAAQIGTICVRRTV